jgi:hypothetical protein
MWIKLTSFAGVVWLSSSCLAQLPAQRVSPVNLLGRYHGFGYSDGYHECKDGKCKTPVSLPKPWAPISSFYGQPTEPPKTQWLPSHAYRSHAPRPLGTAHQTETYVAPHALSQPAPASPGQIDLGPMPSTSSPMPNAPMSHAPALIPVPTPDSPPSSTLTTPKASNPTPNASAPSLYEQVPPAPMVPFPPKTETTQDPDALLDLPPKKSNDSSTQFKRTPPGAFSLLQQTMFQKR